MFPGCLAKIQGAFVLKLCREEERRWAEPDLNRRPLARKANVLTKLDDQPKAVLRLVYDRFVVFMFVGFYVFSCLDLAGYGFVLLEFIN